MEGSDEGLGEVKNGVGRCCGDAGRVGHELPVLGIWIILPEPEPEPEPEPDPMLILTSPSQRPSPLHAIQAIAE